MWSKGLIAAWAILGFFSVSVAIVFAVIKVKLDETVTDSSEMCSSSAPTFEYFESPPTQSLEVWVYNITNPGEFLNGASGADMYELGPYVYDLDVKREDISFYDGESKVRFTLYNQMEFNSGDSCVGCGSVFDDEIIVINPAYSAMLSGGGSEFNILLSTTCTQQQVANMVRNPTAPYCEKTQLSPNLNANCKCCVPEITTFNITDIDPDESLAYCSVLTDPYGPKASLISWLAAYDGGYQLNNIVTAQSFPLSRGLFSPLVRRYTINEMISGSVSALVGLFNYAAFSTGTDEESITTTASILTTTADIKDVCYSSNFGFCPQLADVMADIMALASMPERISYMKGIKCTGQVPDYEILISEGGFSEERAKELRYLHGVSCQQFAVDIAFAALVSLNPANSAICADGGQMPCCMSQFSLNNGAQVGKGMGCLRFVDGVLQKRRVYSKEEAEQYIGSTVAHQTSCASSNSLHVMEWFGDESLLQWFTPSSYDYPNMPWADPIVVNNAGGAVSGSFTSFNVSDGRVLTQMIGTGPGKSFLQQNLNGGNVEREEFEVFLPGLNRNHKIKFDSNDYYDGVRVSKFYMTPGLTSPSEVTQGNGQNPYPNLVNMIYFTEGIPAILSLANFIGVDEDIYQQSSNAKRGYPDYVGVTLYRTRESYNRDAELIEPSEITILTIREFEDDFISWWEFEPATGLTVTNQIASMFSMFTLNCNPMLDPTCTFAREGTTDLCYRTTVGTEAVSSPCSAANVFTPLVQGEKIYPLYWNRVRASPPEDALKAVTDILGVRYAFSILCIVVPGLFFILVLYTVALWARGNGVFESNHNRDSMIGMTNRKSSAPADRTASVDSEINPMQQ